MPHYKQNNCHVLTENLNRCVTFYSGTWGGTSSRTSAACLLNQTYWLKLDAENTVSHRSDSLRGSLRANNPVIVREHDIQQKQSQQQKDNSEKPAVLFTRLKTRTTSFTWRCSTMVSCQHWLVKGCCIVHCKENCCRKSGAQSVRIGVNGHLRNWSTWALEPEA